MGIEHLTFDQNYYQGGGYGGYTDILGVESTNLFEGRGVATAQKFIDKGFSVANTDILVLGCGPGNFVNKLRTDGANAWGMDISQWSVDNAIPTGYVVLGDARVEADLDAVEVAAGVNRWDVIVTAQMIVCLSDADLNTACPMWRDHTQAKAQLDWSGLVHVVHTHIVTEWNPVTEVYDQPYNQKTLAEWRTFLDAQLSGGDRPDWVWRFIDGGEG